MSDDEGASINELLLTACNEDNLDMLDDVLSDPTSLDINHTDGVGNSALHYAARSASINCLEVLLHFHGIDVNIANRIEGDTPLHTAAAYQNPDIALEMVMALVGGGASVGMKNKLGQTPADKAPGDTHEKVKEFLETSALGVYFDMRDIPVDNDDDSDAPSDD
ncbi:hypothetical protein BG011_005854 [Mortierella polycephala]|uniref:Ankyrin n=1 Tax=Mortierella polycephala TaxID=41804 RepID=A0A9P6U8B3_9FUNG|nr:hypothetical protein BG011_005854 [Mortierella polycephala]